ncbi:acyl-[ACP]--phospholipid O-acyltransferase [Acidisphaera sp. L21]|uniref:acyl-[ACP]--phospholipid O-acyltransferase n=1 Tax=Acidisphaera sp. L21 TaxID=1641851 RepID=UPI00131A6445|nr:acyl-[ACP]--phospholipid O-acyltransferase [Acidisphaera sp. L21]
MSLLRSRRLAPLLVTQTLGAINDNLFKNALVVLVLFQVAQGGAAMVAAAGGVFIFPYVLLSATAGQIADRFEKQRTIFWVKVAELGLMVLAAIGFWLGSLPVLFAVLFGLGVQATFFSPLKYSILPNHLAESELVAGNGLVEAGTFLGILIGTIAGGALYALDDGPAIVSMVGLAIAVGGIASAWFIPVAPSDAAGLRVGWNLARETGVLLRTARANRPVWLCLLGLSWFWVVGATLLAELPTLVRDDMGADAHVVTLMLTFFSIGVGAGSLLCARILKGEVTARHVPFAAIGLSIFIWDFAHAVTHAHGLSDVHAVLTTVPGWRMLADLLLLSMCGGLYSVPLYATIQERSAPAARARMIAANNVVNAVAMAGAAVVTALLALAGVAPVTILLLTAVANLAVAIWIMRLLPQETLRALFQRYFETFHGVDLVGLGNVPPAGQRAIFVVNHQSFLDGCFLAAFLPGSPMFAVDINTARLWWVRPFMAAIRHFDVDPANAFSTKAMVEAVRHGERLVIFPEGRITRTGALMKVYDGAGLVADKADAVIVPVRIDGLQFSRLSRMDGRVPLRWFPRLAMTVLPPVSLNLGDDLHGHPRRDAAGAVLQGIMEQSSFGTTRTDRSLFGALLHAQARFGASMPIIEDIDRKPLAYKRVVLGAAVLGRALTKLAPQGGAIGVMLPNANGATVTFMALQAFGRVPAMLNFTAGAEGMLAACTAAGVQIVLSSRAFVEKAKLEAVVERMSETVRFVWLDDVRASLGLRAKLRGIWDARRAHRLPGATIDTNQPAVILFTSGSEGLPKGVVLSHHNILANIAQAAAVVDFHSADRLFNAMPMFHSFGLTGGTLLPLLSGVRAFYYPSPLHYRIVPELIYGTDSTIVFGTDTFLTGWAKFAHPYDFYSVRYIFSGAEKLREETRRNYAERFGVRVLEGYGVTETAPILALNTPMHCRPGTAGRLVPGMEYRLDPVEGIDEGGRLVVRGPNVMLGYLRTEAPGVLEQLEDGWYDTGDICTVDENRFITIRGRAKRFAKIAGEMVSMPAAEALAAGLWPDAMHAVVAVPDGRKGEALILLTTQRDATTGALQVHARGRGVAEIAVPRSLRVVEVLPLLGTGKIDYPSATRLAMEERVAA